MWQKLFELLPIGIVVYDKNNVAVATNRLASEMMMGDYTVAHYVYNQPGIFKLSLHDRTVVAGCIRVEDEQIGSIVYLIDITGWEFYWKELGEYKELIQEVEDTLNSSYDEILVVDGNGIIRRINRAAEKNYGVAVEDMLGKNIFELEKEGYFSPSVCRLVFQERKRLTITQKTKSGKHLIVTGNPIFNEEGEIIRVVVNSRDVSELLNLRKQLEDTEQLAESYRQQLLRLSQEKLANDRIIAKSPQMEQVLKMVEKVAQVDSTVLIMGESGVGKGLVASRIHKQSRRSEGPFITVNCGAIPEHLLETELFGYEGGAFAGARRESKRGLLELAHGGTVFLDEITELPQNLQVKLLQVIQDRRLRRVGGSRYVDVDIRFIAATNRDIQSMVAEGSFREDLYYRLNVIPIIIPPLRYRQEDIPVLIEYFLTNLNRKYERNKKFTQEAVEILQKYHWPGNVRELENLVERLLVTKEGNEITVSHLPDYIFEGRGPYSSRVYVLDICPLKEAVEELEKQLVSMAYNRLKSTYKVADALNINQSTVVRKIQKFNLHISSPEKNEKRTGRRRQSAASSEKS